MGGKGGCTIRHTFGGGAGVLIVVRDMDDMVDIEERPPGDVRPPIREEGELQRPPSTWRELCQDGIFLLDDLLQHGHATVGHLSYD